MNEEMKIALVREPAPPRARQKTPRARTLTEIRSVARSHTRTAIRVLAGIMLSEDATPAARVSADGVTQQARAQTQRPQSSESRGNLPDVGPPLIGDGGQFSAGTAFGNKAADITSKVAYGMMKQVATLPQRAMDASRESFEHRYGPPPSTISDSNVWVDPLIPIAAETAMMMAAPASLMAERGAAGALGGKLPLRPSPEILPEELRADTIANSRLGARQGAGAKR